MRPPFKGAEHLLRASPAERSPVEVVVALVGHHKKHDA